MLGSLSGGNATNTAGNAATNSGFNFGSVFGSEGSIPVGSLFNTTFGDNAVEQGIEGIGNFIGGLF